MTRSHIFVFIYCINVVIIYYTIIIIILSKPFIMTECCALEVRLCFVRFGSVQFVSVGWLRLKFYIERVREKEREKIRKPTIEPCVANYSHEFIIANEVWMICIYDSNAFISVSYRPNKYFCVQPWKYLFIWMQFALHSSAEPNNTERALSLPRLCAQ